MDLFERAKRTGRGHQREMRGVLGLGYGGVPGREANPLDILIFPWEHQERWSNRQLRKDYSVVPELSATLITQQQDPSFPANSGFHILYLSQKVRAGRTNHPHRLHPFFRRENSPRERR